MLRRAWLTTALGLLLEVRRRRVEPLPGFVVVVHRRNRTRRLGREELSRLFLRRRATWPTGEPAAPADLHGDSEVREAFSAQVHRRGTWMVVAYWQQEIASARSTPPPVYRTEQEALEHVRRTPGGVAYVAEGTDLGEGLEVLALEA